MHFGDTALKLGWELRNVKPEWEVGFPAFDTRSIENGELFFALKGEVDGGNYTEAAFKKGAQACVVTTEWYKKLPHNIPLVIVSDTLRALRDLGSLSRSKFTGKVLGITGSCGKTTVKDLIAHVLSQKFKVLKNPASFNNHIGVPYTLARASNSYDLIIIEMGANHPGEISELCALARPTAGLITMVGLAHLEGFGSLPDIAQAKGDLFRGLTGIKTSFVNFDDPYIVGQSMENQSMIGYGFSYPPIGSGFSKSYQGIKSKSGFRVRDEDFHFPFPDFLQIHALSAVAVSHFWGVEVPLIQRALQTFPGVKGRMLRIVKKGLVIYDDTYNSNPSSLHAALKFIASLPGKSKIAVLGDMLELGEYSIEEHRRGLESAKDWGFSKILTFGENFARAGSVHSFATHEDLLKKLNGSCTGDDIILFKGSRSMKMEKVMDKFIAERE